MARESAHEKTLRLIETEVPLWEEGRTVAGIDEVGRGPLAGPVMACCIIIPREKLVDGVDDSKKLSEKKREELYRLLLENADYVRVATLEPEEIDRVNILQATKICMEACAKDAKGAFFLIDAVTGLHLPGESRSIAHGDALSYSIAAASIVAKVARDDIMRKIDALYPEYGFAKNKGYGTREHIEAIRKYGITPIHRKSFLGGICPELL
ncbi:MAG: ribonuclease HII [Christensenellales bacterium]